MPRIRTIKPEFWKSESIAALPFRARLSFIGLWTYVDDNGVGIDNPKLVAAELFPLEEDPRETLANVREDLARLLEAGRIHRYTVDGKPFLAIVNWREHQKIDKPGKPRYPEPDDPRAIHAEPPTSANADPHANSSNPHGAFAESSRDSRETLAPGTGNREQGTGNRERELPPSAERAALALVEPPDTTQALIGEWLSNCNKRPPSNVIGQVSKQVKAMLAEGLDPSDVRRGFAAWHSKGLHPSALPSVVNQFMNAPPTPNPAAVAIRPSTTDLRVAAGLALAAKFDAMEAR